MPKISIAEAILLLMYVGTLDVVGFLLIFVGLDDFFILDLLTFPATQLYFRIKGVRAGYDLATNVLELVPYVGFLPFRTVGVAIVIWQDRHQKDSKSLIADGLSQKLKFVPASFEYIPREAKEEKREAA